MQILVPCWFSLSEQMMNVYRRNWDLTASLVCSVVPCYKCALSSISNHIVQVKGIFLSSLLSLLGTIYIDKLNRASNRAPL